MRTVSFLVQDTLHSTSAHGYCASINPLQSKMFILVLTIHLTGNITHAHPPIQLNEKHTSLKNLKFYKTKFSKIFCFLWNYIVFNYICLCTFTLYIGFLWPCLLPIDHKLLLKNQSICLPRVPSSNPTHNEYSISTYWIYSF